MADGPLPPEEDDFDELDVEELEDALGGFGLPLEDTNSGCTINGNCGCTSSS
ncbi:MAG TPA: hypothetical protein VLK84_11285 [Longimicrobium sp.]|nr:hypothetical protein [Longimicrobium sp.]